MSFNPDPSKQVQKEISDRQDNETLYLPLDTKIQKNMSPYNLLRVILTTNRMHITRNS